MLYREIAKSCAFVYDSVEKATSSLSEDISGRIKAGEERKISRGEQTDDEARESEAATLSGDAQGQREMLTKNKGE